MCIIHCTALRASSNSHFPCEKFKQHLSVPFIERHAKEYALRWNQHEDIMSMWKHRTHFNKEKSKAFDALKQTKAAQDKHGYFLAVEKYYI